MNLSVVVPCFNEEHNIAAVVRQAIAAGRAVASRLEIIVVNDGSTDRTSAVLDDLARRFPELQVVVHDRNRGYGAAVRSGLARAALDYVFLTDGDGQFDLSELPKAVELLGAHDMVAGYRGRRSDGPWRSLWGRCWTLLVNTVFGLGVRDANCAFKLLPRGLVAGEPLTSDGAMISAELLLEARRSRLRIGELEVRHLPRRAGRQSGASVPVVLRACMELVRATQHRARVVEGRLSVD